MAPSRTKLQAFRDLVSEADLMLETTLLGGADDGPSGSRSYKDVVSCKRLPVGVWLAPPSFVRKHSVEPSGISNLPRFVCSLLVRTFSVPECIETARFVCFEFARWREHGVAHVEATEAAVCYEFRSQNVSARATLPRAAPVSTHGPHCRYGQRPWKTDCYSRGMQKRF